MAAASGGDPGTEQGRRGAIDGTVRRARHLMHRAAQQPAVGQMAIDRLDAERQRRPRPPPFQPAQAFLERGQVGFGGR